MATAEIKTKPTKASVGEYLENIKDPIRQKDCKIIVTLMKSVTKKNPVMWGESIVGFGNLRYKSKSGREVEWPVMGFSSRKGPISLYLVSDLNKMGKILEKLGKYKRGVGCLYIKKLSDIDMPTFKKLLQMSAKFAGKI